MIQSLSALEKSAFRSFWGDGLLDLMLGLVVLVLGISWWQDVAVMGAIFPALFVNMWRPLRKRLTEPRMGYVEFEGDRDLKVRSFRHGLMWFFTGTMILGLLVFFLLNKKMLPAPAEWIAGFPLILIGIPAVFFAIFSNCRRFLLYAAVLILAGVQVVVQEQDPHVGLVASGIVITVSGLYILLRFLSRHPAQPPEAS